MKRTKSQPPKSYLLFTAKTDGAAPPHSLKLSRRRTSGAGFVRPNSEETRGAAAATRERPGPWPAAPLELGSTGVNEEAEAACDSAIALCLRARTREKRALTSRAKQKATWPGVGWPGGRRWREALGSCVATWGWQIILRLGKKIIVLQKTAFEKTCPQSEQPASPRERERGRARARGLTRARGPWPRAGTCSPFPAGKERRS